MFLRLSVVSILSLSLLTVSGSVVSATPNLTEPLTIIAHKTGPLDAPFNTTQGITKAKAVNPDLKWVEIDINFNKSNFPVAMHGSDVSESTDGTGLINSLWLSQTQNLNAANYSPWDNITNYPQYHGKLTNADGSQVDKLHPPYGWEFFNAAKQANVGLLLDMQVTPTEAQADKLYSYISNFDYLGKTIYMGSAVGTSAMKSYYPDVTTLVIEYPPADMIRSPKYLVSSGSYGYAIRFDKLSKSIVDMYHDNNLKVFTWTTDTKAMDVASNWQSVKAMGVDALITDHHLEAQDQLIP